MEGFLFQATIYLGAAVIAVPIASRLGLGSVLGYLLAGIIIGPVTGLVGHETEELRHIAEFGVVMMLFLIGLELEPRALWDMRDRLIGLGGLQISLTAGAVTGAAMLLGQPLSVGVAIGLTFALSSTAIVLQTLSEKGLMQTGGGRSVFSVLLTQDIAVIPMLAFLPLLAISGIGGHGVSETSAASHANDGHGGGHAEAAMSFVEGLPGWGVTLVTLGAVAAIVLGGIYLTRPIFRFIHATHLREMYTAVALLLIVGIASLMHLVGLSPALGTFLGGVVLANSEFRHELESDIEPFKGLLLGLFFITVGAGIDFPLLFGNPLMIIGLALGLMALKGVILAILAVIFKLRGRDRWLFALGLAQAGEFGFVLVGFSVQQNVIPGSLSGLLSMMIALSMLFTPLFFIAYERITARIDDGIADVPDADEIDEQGAVIIAGVGRFGQVVNRMVQTAGVRTVVLDHDLETIQLMRRFGFKGFFGDPTRPDLLHAAGLMEARVLVVALDDREAALKLVAEARRERPDLHIVARAYDREHTYRLFRAGANDIVREMFDGSLRAARYVLENTDLTEFEAADHERNFFKQDRHALKEMARLWDPDVPSVENEAYIALAKTLNKEMETSMLNELSGKRRAALSDHDPTADDA
ncbi:MAG: cation:proton antiporter domain-containing protein [Brevirhabdus sp.]